MPELRCDITKVSVISSSSAAGASPVSSSTSLTICSMSPCMICWPLRFTATRGNASPSAAHARMSRHAVRNTQRPMGTMSPDSSANTMNLSGGMSPLTG